jgi:cytidylate kinase
MAIITISRGTMSGGKSVATCLATFLGYPCVAREVVQEAAAALGVPEDAVQHRLQTPPGPWDRLTKERTAYVVAVQAALANHCRSGTLVYHGLAGQFLLRDLPGLLRVRLIAPMAQRVQALLSANHAHTSPEAAERLIRQRDRARQRWVRALYGEDVSDPTLYEVTINLESITLATACVMIAELAGQPQYAATESAREQIARFADDCQRRLDEFLAGNR